ncbi:MAG TPA: ROK family protein [Polyangiaceae bacterium]|nr:ROK family protein [Polyangiaceae bacterium]
MMLRRPGNNGDMIAAAAFRRAGEWLGIAISDLMNILNPAVITIGGGVVLAAATLGDAGSNPFVEAAIAKAALLAHPGLMPVTRISSAVYGNDGGLVGAALMAARSTP